MIQQSLLGVFATVLGIHETGAGVRDLYVQTPVTLQICRLFVDREYARYFKIRNISVVRKSAHVSSENPDAAVVQTSRPEEPLVFGVEGVLATAFCAEIRWPEETILGPLPLVEAGDFIKIKVQNLAPSFQTFEAVVVGLLRSEQEWATIRYDNQKAGRNE